MRQISQFSTIFRMFGVGWGTFYIFLKISCGPPLLTLRLHLVPPFKESKQASIWPKFDQKLLFISREWSFWWYFINLSMGDDIGDDASEWIEYYRTYSKNLNSSTVIKIWSNSKLMWAHDSQWELTVKRGRYGCNFLQLESSFARRLIILSFVKVGLWCHIIHVVSTNFILYYIYLPKYFCITMWYYVIIVYGQKLSITTENHNEIWSDIFLLHSNFRESPKKPRYFVFLMDLSPYN